MRLSYTTKLKSQGIQVQEQQDFNIPLRVRAILQNKCLRRPKSAIKTVKQVNQEQFWVSPLKNMEAPDVIHRNKSQPKKNFYVININDLSKKKRNNSITPSKTRVSTQQDMSDLTEISVIQGIQKSLINKYQTPKCRVYTEPDQIEGSKESFLSALQHQSGIQIVKEQLKNLYRNLSFQLNITSQRELVRRVALEEAHLIDKKNQQTQEWVNKMSPTLKKQLISDKTFWYPSTKLNHSIIMKDMKQIFGVGSSRLMQPGEEASVLELMIQILESQKDILKILNTDSQDIFKQILSFQQLEYLQQFPQCLKQIQYHWQLFVTRLLCIEVKKENNVITNQQLLQLCRRGHALDLRQDRLNNLSQLLLSYLQN